VDDEKAVLRVGQCATDSSGGHGYASRFSRRSYPQNDRATFPYQREAPLGGDVGGRKRLRASDTKRLERLFLGSAPNHVEVGELGRPLLEEVAFATLCLQESHMPIWKRRSEGDPRCSTTGSDIDDRAWQGGHELQAPQRVVEQNPPSPCSVVA
jgi:hypothetical protein